MRRTHTRSSVLGSPYGEVLEAFDLLAVCVRPGVVQADGELVLRLAWWLVIHGRSKA